MTVFFCSKCGTGLTPDLAALPRVPDASDLDADRDKKTGRASSTVARGHYAIDLEPWGAPFVPAARREVTVSGRSRGLLISRGGTALVSAGPRKTVIVHPDDVPALQLLPGGANSSGCCGPSGTGGPNRACRCGVRLATLAADCLGPYELRLDPLRVYAFQQ